ncbi:MULTISPECIES: trigger factor [unclassified Clostridium]|uniref:trigger factor n=1 Tax=unclassified Clostridium TaxID=2614128 RepID=UPI001105E007|nr:MULTISPECIES: trigger factor [unclassified Clostridium]
MNCTMEKLEKDQVRLTIEVDAEQFEKGIVAAYRKMVKSMNIPGFRKGKAPRKVIEQFYGPAIFYEEAFKEVYPDAYEKAIEDNDLQPVDYPEVDITDIGNDGVKFTATVQLKPTVTLGDYKGIKVERPEYTVTDEDVQAEVDRALERSARWIAVEDRPVQDGDRVTLDYAGTVDGVAFEGGTAEGQTLNIGSGMFIPGFEEQMVGMNPGEEKDLNVKFPEEYQAKELAGKDAVFHVKLHDIKEKELPELDDEFAKDVSEFDTLDEYKADIRAKLEEQNKQRADAQYENTLIEKVAENATVEIPQVMIERQIDNMMREFEMRLMYQGLRLDDYFTITGSKAEDARAEFAKDADTRVKVQLVLEAIQEAEKIEATPEELDAEIAKMAEQANKPVEEYRASLQPQDMAYLTDMIVMRKTVALLKGE